MMPKTGEGFALESLNRGGARPRNVKKGKFFRSAQTVTGERFALNQTIPRSRVLTGAPRRLPS